MTNSPTANVGDGSLYHIVENGRYSCEVVKLWSGNHFLGHAGDLGEGVDEGVGHGVFVFYICGRGVEKDHTDELNCCCDTCGLDFVSIWQSVPSELVKGRLGNFGVLESSVDRFVHGDDCAENIVLMVCVWFSVLYSSIWSLTWRVIYTSLQDAIDFGVEVPAVHPAHRIDEGFVREER